MSVNKGVLAEMYVDKKMSIPDISKDTGIAKSMVRFYLLKQGIKLRTRKEGLALVKHKLATVNKGRKRVFSEEWRAHISEGRKRYWDKRAKGYDIHNGYIRLSRGSDCGKLEHVAIMEQSIGRRIRKDEVVHHINGNRSDNRIENLQLMNRAEHCRIHAKDRYAQGLCYDISKETKRGEEHRCAKLTWEDVEYIRSSQKTTKELAQMFNVSKSVINKVKSFKTWRIKNVS